MGGAVAIDVFPAGSIAAHELLFMTSISLVRGGSLKLTSHSRAGRGFTLIEMMVVIAVFGILAAMTAVALTRLKTTMARRGMASDLYSQLSVARARARAKERAQIIVIDAIAGGNQTFGYFFFEDTTLPSPTLFSAAQLNALVTAMATPPGPPTVPAGYTLALLDSRTSTASPSVNGFYMNADSWGGAAPFPWTNLMVSGKIDTTGGCSFCSAGYGAVAFLPSGRAVFSDQNTLGGFIVLAGDAAGPATAVMSAIGISPSGFVQQVEHP
jgi:prepilin-type N-terminal cleavage/methylation domain-containing protein